MTPRTQFISLGLGAACLGGFIVALGISEGGDNRPPVLEVLGGLTPCLGFVLILLALLRFSARRRIPASLRLQSTAPLAPYTLTLQNGERVTAIAVFPGGYVVARRTDPTFDARDVVALAPSTPDEVELERQRQQQSRS